MNLKSGLIACVMMPSLASCAQPQARVNLTPPLASGANSQTPTVTEHFIPCSSLTIGKVSQADTVETLAWVLPLRAVIEDICGTNRP